MRLTLIFGVLITSGIAPGQRMFDMEAKSGEEARRVFETVWNKQSGDPVNSCSVQVYQPRLDFGMNLWTGWNAEYPMTRDQLKEKNPIVSVFRVTPKGGGKTVYFGESQSLYRVPKGMEGQEKLVVGSGGGFRVGPGKYEVQWMLAHPEAGVCRKSWELTAKAPKEMTPTLAAGGIGESMFNAWRGFSGRPGIRATVLVHAAPIRWRRNVNRLSAWERNVLLAMLRTVLDRGQISEARVVVFDLEQGRTFFETDLMTRDGYFQLARELAQADFGTIDLKTYQRGQQHWPYLEEKLKAELARETRPDAIIFLGPSTQQSGRPPAELRSFKNKFTDLFYIALSPFMGGAQDQISQLVRSLDGKVYSVWEPKDLAKAVARIKEETSDKPRSGTGSN